MSAITSLSAREILDSRGRPTIEARIELACGVEVVASVPSGASTGKHEAHELRDGGMRYHGRGVLKAVEHINGIIATTLLGSSVSNQAHLDGLLLEVDGTPHKSNLGANAILATSMVIARAAAAYHGLPLYRYLGGSNARTLPTPLINVLNGGMHADNGLEIQEFMVVPLGQVTFAEKLRAGAEIFESLKSLLKEAGYSTNVGDEGGFAPALSTPKEALDFLMKAIEKAGYEPGEDVFLALDVAATEFYKDDGYHMRGMGVLSADDMIGFYKDLAETYPLFSIEDGLAEDDWFGWQKLTEELGEDVQLVGDDLFVTHSHRLLEGITQGAANAILIKPNQVGTVTETLETIELAQKAGYENVISHRSGETEDTFIADLSVAKNCSQIKTGSTSRTDRLCKYNRLLEIEQDLGTAADIFSLE